MNRIFVLSIGCLLATLPAWAGDGSWTPNFADVQKLEDAIGPIVNFSNFKCPPQKITDFARYYTGLTDENGHRIIVGQLLLVKDRPDREAGVHIQSTRSGYTDGGCGIADVSFDAQTSKLVEAVWGGGY